MKQNDLEKYRNTSGFIDMDKALNENKVNIINEVRGSQNRDKFWIELDDNSSVLLRTENLDECKEGFTSYAELIMEELANQVGIPAAHYDLIQYNGKKGVISSNVVDKSINESMFTLTEISGNDVKANEANDIVTIFNNVKDFASFEDGLDQKDLSKMYLDIAKISIFDTFTMSNDRHGENISIIYSNDDDGKKHLKIAPIFDNECSLMLDNPDIDKLLKDKTYLKRMVNLQEQSIISPEEYQDSKEGWSHLLYYITDSSDEAMDFTNECYENINIDSAIQNVEKRINSKLPEELKELVTETINERKRQINKYLYLSFDDMEVGL